jgi:hypothetical protein
MPAIAASRVAAAGRNDDRLRVMVSVRDIVTSMSAPSFLSSGVPRSDGRCALSRGDAGRGEQWSLGDDVDVYGCGRARPPGSRARSSSGNRPELSASRHSHSRVRSSRVAVQPRALNLAVPTCTSTSGVARRLRYQPGCCDAPPFARQGARGNCVACPRIDYSLNISNG